MNLVVDIGNTLVKLAVFDDGRLVAQRCAERLLPSMLDDLLSGRRAAKAVVASTRGATGDAAETVRPFADYLLEFFQRHPVRIKSNVCRSLLITDLRALNAWCLFYHLFYFILAVYAFHTANVKSFSADIHVFRTSWRES